MLGYILGGVVLGLGLATGQLLPCLELVRESVRTHLTLAQANRFILPPYAALTNFVCPDFYGNPATDANYVARGNFWEPCAFIGLLPFGFALWAGVRLFRGASRDVRFWAAVGLLGVWLSMGKDAGLWAVAFSVLPGVSKFHDAARWLYVGTWGLACLAALGMDAFLRAQAPVRRRLWAAAIVSVTAWQVVTFGRTLNPTTPASVWAKSERGTADANRRNGRTFFADSHRAWARWVSYQTYRNLQSDEDVLRFLQSQTPNTGILPEASGYEPVRRTDTDALLTTLQKQVNDNKEKGVAQAMGITDITRLDSTFTPETRPIPDARGRAVLATWWNNASTGEAAIREVTAPHWTGVPVITGLPQPLAAGVFDTLAPQPLRVVDSSPQRVLVLLPSGEHAAGVVVLADTRHPGWTARVDDGPAGVPLSANGAFRAVAVGKNDKQVEFVYLPASVRIGVFISLVAAGILSAITLCEYCRLKGVIRGGTGA